VCTEASCGADDYCSGGSCTPRFATADAAPTSLTFGSTYTGRVSVAKTVSVTNHGNKDLVVASAEASGQFVVAVDNCHSAVAPNGSCTIDVTFNPTTAGAKTGTLTISSNASAGDILVSLSGTALLSVPATELSPASLAFGNQPVAAASSARTVTLTSSGTGALELAGVAVSAGVADFSQTNDCPASLEPEASCTVSVVFTPSALFARSGTLTFQDNASDSPQTVSLSGTGTGAAAVATPASLTFSQTYTGYASAPQNVTLTNNGNAALVVTSVGASGQFAISNNGCESAVAPGGSCTIGVTFEPTSGGMQSGTLTVVSNSVSGNATVALSGTAMQSVATAQLSTLSVSFGNQHVGATSGAQTVTLSNTGQAALTMATAYSGDFAGTDDCNGSVAPGTSCHLAVTCTPTATGVRTGALTITDNAAGPHLVSLSANGVLGTAGLSTSTLAFTQAVGTTSAAQTVTVTNSGTDALAISSVAAGAPFAVSAHTCTSALAPAATCTVSVTFAPAALGPATGTLTIASDGSNPTATVSLSGTGTGATADVSPASLAFDETYTGYTSAPRTVTVTNSGNLPLNVTSASASGPFAVSDNRCASAVAAQASCTVAVTFHPTAAGEQTGTLTIVSNSIHGDATASLSGMALLSVPIAQLSTTELLFGNRHVGTASDPLPVTLTNTGRASMAVSSVAVTAGGAEFAQTNNCGMSVAANAGCTVQVTFTPSAAGSRVGLLSITDDATGSPHTVVLTGAGVIGTAVLTSTSMGFGSRRVGTTSAEQEITVKNVGTDALVVTGATATGPFAATNTCVSALAIDGTCTVSVTFTPTAGGAASGVLTLASNGSNPTETVTLSGDGIEPVATLSRTSLDFAGRRPATASGAASVTLTNTGSAPLGVSSIGITAGSSDFTQTNDCAASLAEDASCTIAVVFAPAAAGARTGTLSVADDAAGSPHSVSLSGSGIIGTVSLAPASLSFTTGAGTTSAAQIVTVTSTGTDAVTISGVSTPSARFAVTHDCTAPLAPDATCSVSVTFSPTAMESTGSTLTVASDASNPSATVSLSGIGTCGTDSYCGTGKYCGSGGSCLACSATNAAHCGTASSAAGCAVCSGATPACVSGECRAVPACPAGYVQIPAGEFDMGSPTTEPGRNGGADETQHHVTLSRGFCMKEAEVTEAEWLARMGTPLASCGDNCPVVRVSWWDALTFANALSTAESLPSCYTLTGCGGGSPGTAGYACTGVTFQGLTCTGYRLPTEAEWEYAARAGTTTATYNGTSSATAFEEPNAVLDPIAWFWGNAQSNAHPVKQLAANAFGLFDVLGNAAEWCWDWAGTYPSTPTTDPLGAAGASGRAVRGGSMGSAASYSRAAYRGTYSPGDRFNFIGFRLAKSAPTLVREASLSPTSLAFADQAPGTTSAGQTVTVTNTGTDTLTISSVTATAPFAATNTCTSPLAVGGTCTVSVTFAPTAIGSASGTLTIASNGSNPSATVSLSGTACTAGYVWIPPGEFDMGSPGGEPGRSTDETQHHVVLTRGFCMKETEVTQGEWQALMSNNPSGKSPGCTSCPVETVSWWDALAYANALSASQALQPCYVPTGDCSGTPGTSGYSCPGVTFVGLGCPGYRLPTEAEWEYAARAGTGTATYDGTSSLTGCETNTVVGPIAWFCGNASGTTHAVKGKLANDLGLYDMLGNVWEWCWDWYGTYPTTAETDPLGASPGSWRVLRGGGWVNGAGYERAARRNNDGPANRSSSFGLRPVRSGP